MRRFTKWYDPSTDEGEFDSQTFMREFTGRMTKKRWKIIQSVCRRHCKHLPCDCEHDCCGCVCGKHMSADYKHNQVTIFYRESYNY